MTFNYSPAFLAILLVIVFIWLGIEPVSREVWIAEVIPIVLVFLLLVFTFKRYQFSNLSYALMSAWMFWHTIGAHFTFAEVPFDYVNNLMGSERNQFDRVGHFIIGFYAYPMTEWLLRKGFCGIKLALLFGLFFIMSVSAAYEMIEWQYALHEGGEAGIDFLGSQGDVWDAQKDMFADTLGAIFSLILFLLVRPDRERRLMY